MMTAATASERAEDNLNTYQIRPKLNNRLVEQMDSNMEHCMLLLLRSDLLIPSGVPLLLLALSSFRQSTVKECIHVILAEQLSGKTYSSKEASQWTKHISSLIKDKLKELGYERYKFVVQVIIGEQRGEGVMAGSRCLWDSATDNYASDVFLSETFFCVATAFGVYYY